MTDNRGLIIEYVSSSETLKTQLSEQDYSVNWKEVCPFSSFERHNTQ